RGTCSWTSTSGSSSVARRRYSKRGRAAGSRGRGRVVTKPVSAKHHSSARRQRVKILDADAELEGAMSELQQPYEDQVLQRLHEVAAAARYVPAEHQPQRLQIGRASCRES